MQTDRNALWSSSYSQKHIWTSSTAERRRSWRVENICEALFLSLLLHHFSHPLPVIFDIYFWARWLALHGLALGAALSRRRPLVCPPSVSVAGREYQTFEVINLKECVTKFSLCFGDIGSLELDLFQWQTNNHNLTLFVINDIAVYSSNFDFLNNGD